jgi:O-antigen ligase
LAPYFAAGIGLVTCILAAWAGVNFYAADMSGRLIANERLNPISLGHSAAITAISLIWLLFFRIKGQVAQMPASSHVPEPMEKEKVKPLSAWSLPLGIGAIALSVYVLVLSASRSPALGFVICVLLIIVRLRAQVVHFVVTAVLVAVALYQLGFIEQLNFLNIATSRIVTVGDGASDFEGGRGDLYAVAWEMFKNSPFLGESLFVFGFAYPHNIFLEALMATGLLGGSLLAVMLWKGILTFIAVSRRGNLGFWVLLLFVQALVATMTSGAIFSDPMFWSTLGLGIGLTVPREPQQDMIRRPRCEISSIGRGIHPLRFDRRRSQLNEHDTETTAEAFPRLGP